MYTIGGIFSENNLSSPSLAKKDNFFEADENKIVDIDVPLLTYCEKMKLDKNISKIKNSLSSLNKEEIVNLLGFEMEPSELKSYLDYYRYYPQYYEGIIWTDLQNTTLEIHAILKKYSGTGKYPDQL